VKERNEDSHSRAELRAAGATNGAIEKSPEARGLSQTMRDPARRKRNASQKTKNRCRMSANGHGGESSSLIEPLNGPENGQMKNGKTNGPETAERRGSGSVPACAGRLANPELERSAASDDASGTTFAEDAGLPSTAVCIGREACAEVADLRFACQGEQAVVHDEESGTDDDRRPRACDDSKKSRKSALVKNEGQTKEYPPGIDEPLAFDAPGFVDEMHARVNLFEVYKDLLTSPDLKVKQRATEFLMEMKYGKGAPAGADEVTRVDVEFPKP
jgi:hypothetical protein